MDDKIKSALDAAGTAADYSARATYQRGYDAGVKASPAKNGPSEESLSFATVLNAEAARADAAEAREWALGVQVVAQAQRLKLAEAVVDEARYGQPTLAMRQALAAWDTVPGMEP